MARLTWFVLVVALVACSSPPKKPVVPALTPEAASQLLHYDGRAQAWLVTVRKQNPACDYQLDLPDQRTHPAEVDLNHIMYCGGQPSPTEFNASVVFTYDTDKQQWVISRFA